MTDPTPHQAAAVVGQAIALVRFRWGTLDLGLPACRVLALESGAGPDAAAIGELLGLPGGGLAAAPGVTRLLRVAGPTGVLRLRVQEPVTQARLPAAAIHPLPPLLAARLRLPWVRALAYLAGEGAGTLIVILDPGAPIPGGAPDRQP